MTTSHSHPLLVELVTEELPPRALEALGNAFATHIRDTLRRLNLLQAASTMRVYATPRRLAVWLDAVLAQAPDQLYQKKLMPVEVGLDDQGRPTPALVKRLAAHGAQTTDPDALVRRADGKKTFLYLEGTATGARLHEGLQQALEQAVTHLPVPKMMRYQLADGHTSVHFVRPAHRLVALWGDEVVPVHILGLQAGRQSLGHRFMGPGVLDIASATTWADTLAQTGYVMPSFQARRACIARQLEAAARERQTTLGDDPAVAALLDEVTALVEYPSVYAGSFEPRFLAVPPECLILTMRLNQKYFPLFDPQTGKLTHHFLIVSNMKPEDPGHIIRGNQRVVRPRLADAEFFYQTDLKTPLAARVASLADSIYHNRLGTQRARTQRVQALAQWLAPLLGGQASAAARAAELAHADLGTLMVGEFPELQGIMGAYYAEHDGEPAEVVRALRDQYRLRLDAPVTTATLTAAILYLAERAETLIGIWGIGEKPTGERDPFGLRRAALGLISAYEQLAQGGFLRPGEDSPARLSALLAQAAAGFASDTLAADTVPAVTAFVYERYRHLLAESHDRAAVDAVLALQPPLHQVPARVAACTRFAQRPEAEALVAAHKRVANLLRKAPEALPPFDPTLLQDPAEKQLASTIAQLAPATQQALQAGDFTGNLTILAQARAPVDRFFDEVMVMVEDKPLRTNRLALLDALHDLMNQVADLSRLAT